MTLTAALSFTASARRLGIVSAAGTVLLIAVYAVTLSAIFGTAAMTPITAAGHSAQPLQERLVTAGFMTVGIAIIASSVLILWGLRRSAAPQSS